MRRAPRVLQRPSCRSYATPSRSRFVIHTRSRLSSPRDGLSRRYYATEKVTKMFAAVKADDVKDALLKAGLTDEVLDEGEAALDQILNKVEVSQVQRVRFKQWYRKNMAPKPAAAQEKKETKEGKDFEIPKLTPEEEEIVQKVEAKKRERLSIFDGAEKWVMEHLRKEKTRREEKQQPLATRVAMTLQERYQVLRNEVTTRWQKKVEEAQVVTHVTAAAWDFHPKEAFIWFELYMQRFFGLRRYKAPEGVSSLDLNAFLFKRAWQQETAKRVATRDAFTKAMGFSDAPAAPLLTDEQISKYHASGVEALAFFRGQIDANRGDLLSFARLVLRIRLILLAIFLVFAALMVVAMGDRIQQRQNGVLQYMRALRIGAVSLVIKASKMLNSPQVRDREVKLVEVPHGRAWKSMV